MIKLENDVNQLKLLENLLNALLAKGVFRINEVTPIIMNSKNSEVIIDAENEEETEPEQSI